MTTCIRGRVLMFRAPDPTNQQPWPSAPIKVTDSDSGNLITEGMTNSLGEYLIHDISRGIYIDIEARGESPGRGKDYWDECKGKIERIHTGLKEAEVSTIPTGWRRITWKLRTSLIKSSPQPQMEPCIEIDDILAQCYPLKKNNE